LIEARFGRGFLHRLQHSRDAERGEFAGEDGLRPRCLHEALRGEIVDLVDLEIADDVGERRLVERSADASSTRSTRCPMRSYGVVELGERYR
jgi:hypothetical protein